MTGIVRSASVVLPARNAAAEIGEQLAALSAQRCDVPWEVVVADHGSSDGTAEVVRGWVPHLPGLRLVDAAGEPTSYAVRNLAARAAAGDALLFCDADDVVGESWLAAHVDALRHEALVTGPVDTRRLNAPAARVAGPPSAVRDGPPVGNGFLPYALGANLGIRRALFEQAGGFDGLRSNGGDKVLSWWAQLAGHRLHFAPDAVVHYRLRTDARSTYRRQLRIGRAAPSLHRRFRDAGMPRSSLREAAGEWTWLLATAAAPRTPEMRLRYARTAGRRVGRLVGSVEARALYL